MKAVNPILLIIHFFVGLGALGISDPTLASMAADAGEMLENAPFDDFLIPGLFLFIVIGLGNLVAGVTAIRKWKLQGYASGAMGAILIAWIVIQCFMLREINILHVVFFIIGAVQGLLALWLAYRQDLFPLDYVKRRFSV
jgi:hypothetical protein